MDREAITSVIEMAAPELRARGVEALYLFGSQARGEAKAESDIDLAFDVRTDADKRFSLADQGKLQMHLEELFGRKVDFVERRAFHPDLKRRIERDLVRIL